MFYQEIVTAKCPLQFIKDLGEDAAKYMFVLDDTAVDYLRTIMSIHYNLKKDLGNDQNIVRFVSRNKNREIDSTAIVSKICDKRWLITCIQEEGIYFKTIPAEPDGQVVIAYDKNAVEES